jgi:hypothetical protein
LLSYVDVLLVSLSVSRGSASKPDDFTWWKVLGLHLCGGFGLAYADSSAWRKGLYPTAFLVGAFALLDLNQFYVVSDFVGWEIVEITLYLAVVLYGFSFVDVILTGQSVSRGAKSIPKDLSWWKALGFQLTMGFGLSYEDASLNRRWLYPTAFVFSLIAYLDLTDFNLLTRVLPEDVYIGMMLFAMAAYFFGFVDVLLTYSTISRGSQTVPDDLSWWKALGLHFCFGSGLAYVDSSLKRKWLYPVLFMPILIRLVLYAEFEVLFRYPFGHLYFQFLDYLEMLFYFSVSVFALGMLDVLLTYRARRKMFP